MHLNQEALSERSQQAFRMTYPVNAVVTTTFTSTTARKTLAQTVPGL